MNLMYTASNFDYIQQELRKVDLTTPKRIHVTEWKEKRGLSANALSWVWYNTIGTELGMTDNEVHADSKIQFGLPILFRSGSDYAYSVSRLLDGVKFYKLSCENQRRAINPIAVTSKFNTKEMSEYMESIQRFYGLQGINLESK